MGVSAAAAMRRLVRQAWPEAISIIFTDLVFFEATLEGR